VRNWLSEHRTDKPPLPGITALWADYNLFKREVSALLIKLRQDPLKDLTHSDFLLVVRDWIETRA